MRRNQTDSRLGFHVCLGPRDGGVLVTSPEARRILARAVHECCAEAGLLGFALADNHLHLQLTCSRAEAGRVARRLGQMLGWRLRIIEGMETRFIRPIENGSHLKNTFRYLAGQAVRHGVDPCFDPWCETTSLPDLLGIRPAGGHVIRQVGLWLPRLTIEDVMQFAGLPRLAALTPTTEPVDELVDAALATAMLPSLVGGGSEIRAARRAIIAVVGQRQSATELARLVELAPSSLRRVRQEPADPSLVLGIQRQLGLRQLRRQVVRDLAPRDGAGLRAATR